MSGPKISPLMISPDPRAAAAIYSAWPELGRWARNCRAYSWILAIASKPEPAR